MSKKSNVNPDHSKTAGVNLRGKIRFALNASHSQKRRSARNAGIRSLLNGI